MNLERTAGCSGKKGEWVIGTRCVYCGFGVLPGNQVYTVCGAPAHWQCAAVNDRWEQRIRKQVEARALLPDGIEQQLIEAWEQALGQVAVPH